MALLAAVLLGAVRLWRDPSALAGGRHSVERALDELGRFGEALKRTLIGGLGG